LAFFHRALRKYKKNEGFLAKKKKGVNNKPTKTPFSFFLFSSLLLPSLPLSIFSFSFFWYFFSLRTPSKTPNREKEKREEGGWDTREGWAVEPFTPFFERKLSLFSIKRYCLKAQFSCCLIARHYHHHLNPAASLLNHR